jgi:hypothetical protein
LEWTAWKTLCSQPRIGEGTAAPVSATLDKWRWEVASACRELLRFGSLDQALSTGPRRPSPLVLPEQKPERMGLTYGPELLPNTGFEAGARELILPPFVPEAEQTLIDGSDKNLSARIRQFGSAEIHVKAQFPGVNRAQIGHYLAARCAFSIAVFK